MTCWSRGGGDSGLSATGNSLFVRINVTLLVWCENDGTTSLFQSGPALTAVMSTGPPNCCASVGTPCDASNAKKTSFPSLKSFTQNSEKTVAGRIENLKPWKPGESGNPGGRPKTKPLTSELERLLEEEAPKAKGQTWAALIAQALLRKARKGDVRAITEVANRVEGRPFQAVALDLDASDELVARIQRGRKRFAEMSDKQLQDAVPNFGERK